MTDEKVYEDVGMINPFALYEVIFKEKGEWKQLTHDKKKEKLEKLFAKGYKKLWDPKNGSPLYPWTHS